MTQLDLNGDVVPQKLCKCGCGNPVINRNDYIWGHNMKSDADKEFQSQRMFEICNGIKWKKSQSDILKQYYIDNPDVGKEHSEWMKQYYIDNPGVNDINSQRQKQFRIDNPELSERSSAEQQGQDYDAGEWTGFTNQNRSHVKKISQCILVNDWFDGAHGHHITKSIVTFIPADLHGHIQHNLKTGANMGEMNALAIQFINGGL